MKFSTTALVLATLAIETASAASIRHAHKHIHEKKDAAPNSWTPPPGYDYHTDPAYLATANGAQATPAPAPAAAAPKPDAGLSLKQKTDDVVDTTTSGLVTAVDSAFKVGSKQILAGTNNGDTSDNGFVWQGKSGGAFSNTIKNTGKTDYTLAVFRTKFLPLGKAQWIDQYAPALTLSIPAGASTTLQFADNVSGAFVPIAADNAFTEMGLLAATLGEFTTKGDQTTFDVSREWFSEGSGMTIKGRDGCVSSTINNECAFVCTKFDYGKTCGTAGSYDLIKSSNVNCHKGVDDGGQPTGGCYADKKIVTELF